MHYKPYLWNFNSTYVHRMCTFGIILLLFALSGGALYFSVGEGREGKGGEEANEEDEEEKTRI